MFKLSQIWPMGSPSADPVTSDMAASVVSVSLLPGTRVVSADRVLFLLQPGKQHFWKSPGSFGWEGYWKLRWRCGVVAAGGQQAELGSRPVRRHMQLHL